MSMSSKPELKIDQRLGKVGEYSASNPLKVIAATVLILAVAGLGASQIQMNMGMELYIDDNSQVNQDWQELQKDFNKGNVVFVVLESEEDYDIYSPENMKILESVYQDLYEEVESAGLVTSMAHPVKAGPGGGEIPETSEDVKHSLTATQQAHYMNENVIKNLHPDMYEENSTAVIMVQYGDVEVAEDDRLLGLLPVSEEEVVERQVRDVLERNDLPEELDVTVTGDPVFEDAAFGMMLPEMIKLFSAAFLVILTTVFFVMRGRLGRTRNVLLPLTSSLAALVLMMGFMGFLGFNFNAIMLGVLPIALGLSIDYGLQIQTRYTEERGKGRDKVEAGSIAAKNTGKALAIAMTTTAIGLGALLISDVPPTRQFGATSISAIAGAMVLSVTFLVALLVLFDRGNHSKKGQGLENKVKIFTGKILEHKEKVLGIGLIAVLLGGLAAPYVDTTDDMLDYWPQIQERHDITDLEESVASPNIMYVIVEDEDVYSPESFREIGRFQNMTEEHENIVTTVSAVKATEATNNDWLPETQEELDEQMEIRAGVDRPPTVSQPVENHPDRLLIQVFVEDISGETEREVIDYIESEAQSLEQDTRVTGKLVVNRNVIENVTSGLGPMTGLSFGLGLLFLTVALRSVKESAVLIGSVAVSAVLMLTGAMYLFGIPWNPLTVTVAAIVLGIGIDYGVHVNERYKEELGQKDSLEAMKTAVAQKSRPILGSGLTTLLGFGVLVVSDFPVLANFGYAVVFAMTFALVATFVLLPVAVLTVERLEGRLKTL